ncbi:putative colanic acid biosynthesis acetyltransferase [Sphingomonas sp. ZT3P38]|uniref:putative colanic acid biosynthesis acetyltransferase n=1 Tax=Parasphingomonas zepuensis TaxID=3096161 RepID=UPI002FC839ED
MWLVLASWTPRALHGWRRFLLKVFGARMGQGADVRGSARIWYPPHLVMEDRAVIGPRVTCYNQAEIRLGQDSLVSQGAHLCAGTHDFDDPAFQLIARPIRIGRDVWIAAEAFVGPGTVIGDRAVVGARAVAFGTLAPNMVYRGNPATALRIRRGAVEEMADLEDGGH